MREVAPAPAWKKYAALLRHGCPSRMPATVPTAAATDALSALVQQELVAAGTMAGS